MRLVGVVGAADVSVAFPVSSAVGVLGSASVSAGAVVVAVAVSAPIASAIAASDTVEAEATSVDSSVVRAEVVVDVSGSDNGEDALGLLGVRVVDGEMDVVVSVALEVAAEMLGWVVAELAIEALDSVTDEVVAAMPDSDADGELLAVPVWGWSVGWMLSSLLSGAVGVTVASARVEAGSAVSSSVEVVARAVVFGETGSVLVMLVGLSFGAGLVLSDLTGAGTVDPLDAVVLVSADDRSGFGAVGSAVLGVSGGVLALVGVVDAAGAVASLGAVGSAVLGASGGVLASVAVGSVLGVSGGAGAGSALAVLGSADAAVAVASLGSAALGAGLKVLGSADVAAGALAAVSVAPAAADCAVASTDPPATDPPAMATEVVCQARSAVSSALATASQIDRATRRSFVPESGNRVPQRTSGFR